MLLVKEFNYTMELLYSCFPTPGLGRVPTTVGNEKVNQYDTLLMNLKLQTAEMTVKEIYSIFAIFLCFKAFIINISVACSPILLNY